VRTILFSLCTAALLSAASNDPQSILSEVSKLRQMYEECKANESTLKAIDPKAVAASSAQAREIAQKNGIIKSLERTLLSRDRAYREATTQNKNLILQLHTQKVSMQERETLKRALETAKADLLLAQKELKKAGGVKIVYKDHPVVQEKIVTKTVESTQQINSLQHDLAAAQTTIAHLQNTKMQTVANPKIIEKIVYRDRPVVQEKIVEKVVYKDRPAAKEKVIEKVVYKDREVVKEKIVYKDRPVVQEKVVEKVVYKDRPIPKEKIVEKVVYKERIVEKPVEKIKVVEKIVYKDRPVVQEKIVEKIVYKELPVPKNKPQTIVKAEASKQQPVKQQVSNAKAIDEEKWRQADKVALEAERKKSVAVPLTKKVTPSAYRMATNATVYSTPNGIKVDTWESGRSFTSGTSRDGWVKITGYFVNRVWQAASEELWVKESDVIKR